MGARGKWLFDVTEEEIEEAKKKYSKYVSKTLMSYVDQMSEFNQEVFWRHIAANIEDSIDQEFLRRLCEVHKPSDDVPDEIVSATPFKDAEMSISSGSWFGNSVSRRL